MVKSFLFKNRQNKIWPCCRQHHIHLHGDHLFHLADVGRLACEWWIAIWYFRHVACDWGIVAAMLLPTSWIRYLSWWPCVPFWPIRNVRLWLMDCCSHVTCDWWIVAAMLPPTSWTSLWWPRVPAPSTSPTRTRSRQRRTTTSGHKIVIFFPLQIWYRCSGQKWLKINSTIDCQFRGITGW